MREKFNISDFLKGQETRMVFENKEGDERWFFLKEEIKPDTFLVFERKEWGSSRNPTNYGFAFIYNRRNNTISNDYYSFEWEFDAENIHAERMIVEDFRKRADQYCEEHHEELMDFEMNYNYKVRDDNIIRCFVKDEDYCIKYSENLINEHLGYHNITDYMYSPVPMIDRMLNAEIRKQFNGICKDNEFILLVQGRDYLQKKLEELENNKQWYLNRTIYRTLKQIEDAKTVNITIHMDEDELTFKFDLHTLKINLTQKESCYGWSKSYDEVGEFCHSHNSKHETRKDKNHGYNLDNFYFEDIVKITYGRKTIYERMD